MVVAFVGVSQPKRNALQAAGLSVPPPVQIQALIDTGASDLCVDPSVLNQLGLVPTGSCQVNTPTTGQQPCQAAMYDVFFSIPSGPGQPTLTIQAMPAISSQLLLVQGFHALIGRSVLKNCLLVYDGQAKIFSLAY